MAYPYNSYLPQYTPQQVIPQQTQQNNGLTSVRTKEEAQYYPVAPGNSLIFRKDDGSSMYIKTMGYSSTEPPIFEEYARVVTEEKKPQNKYDEEISKLWGEINALKKQPKNKNDGGS